MGESAIEAGKAFLKLLIDNKELQPGLDSSLAKLKSFAKSAIGISAQLGGLGAAISAPFAVGLHTFSETGDQLQKMSERTGIAASALSELKFAAEQSDTDLGGFETALRRMQKTLGDAENGSGKAAAKFEQIGLSVRELANLSPDEQFSKVAKAIAGIADPTQRAAAAMAIFGKSGTTILPMALELDTLREKAKAAGVTMSDEAAAAAEKLHDAMKLLRQQTTAVSNALGSALAPAVTAIADAVAPVIASVIDFIKNNQELVTVVAVVGTALTAFASVLGFVGVAGLALVAGIGFVGGAVAAVGAAIAAVVGVIASVAVILGPTIASWLGLSTATDEATEATKKSTTANVELADSHAKVNKKLEERAEALKRLTTGELEWLAIAEREEATNKLNKAAADLRVKGLDSETRAVDEETQAQINELYRLQEVKKRLLGEQAQGGSAKFQNRVKENLTDVEEKIAASHAEIERLQKERQDLVDKRDQLTGKAAKDNKKQIDEADKALKEKHKEQAKEQARLQKELAEQQKKDDAERFRLQQSISQTVAREFGNASRETRGGFGGQLAEQIAGTTSGDTVQVKMLDLTVKQLAELQKLNATIGTAGILTFGAE
jgi:hypothetical protein